MANPDRELIITKRDTVDIVSESVRKYQERGELHFPANYSPENALKAAWLTIQEVEDRNHKPAIEVCTRISIVNALLNMVVQGLNPAKKQCYFIVYGNKLVLQRSYFGSMHIAKTVDPNIKEIVPDVVYKDDVFSYGKERGRTVILKHEQKLENIKKGHIVAAYCSVFYKDGTEQTTIMTFDEIKQAWKQSQMNPIDEKGNIKDSSVHGKFSADMAKKTVVNRACKAIINASDDSNLVIMAYNNTDDDIAEAQAQEEVDNNANKSPLFIDEDTGEVTFNEPTEETSEESVPAKAEDDLP
jgi:recombination protein RecT